MDMKFSGSTHSESAATFALRYQLIELQEFEFATTETASVRAVLGDPLEDGGEVPHLASLPLVIVGYDAHRIGGVLAVHRGAPETSVRPIVVVGLDDTIRAGELVHWLADSVLPPRPARENLLNAGRNLAAVSRRIVDIPLQLNDRALLLLQLVHSRNHVLEPTVDPGAPMAYDYPLANAVLGVGAEESLEMLEDMARHGIFDATVVDRVFVCPDCHSYRVPVKELCPECHSSNLVMENSMHHFRCGFIAPESEFMTHGKPICPKCHASMRHIGVEYNRPGYFSVCRDCGYWVSEPDLRAWCVACNTCHLPNELVPVHIKRFALSERGTQIARAGSWNVNAVRALPYKQDSSTAPGTGPQRASA